MYDLTVHDVVIVLQRYYFDTIFSKSDNNI